MDRIVFYSETIDPGKLTGDGDDIEVVPVYSQRRLIECLIDDASLVAAVVQVPAESPEWSHFLQSLSQSFPLLPVLVLRRESDAGCPDEYPCLDPGEPDADIAGAVRELTGGREHGERRSYHRFAWPLTATMVGGDGSVHRISEISAGGAYLEPMGSAFSSGEEYVLEIHFQNFKMKVGCIILDPRHMSSGRSGGFGVRFSNLSEEAAAFVDGIVEDALIEVLLDPNAHPAVPSLDDGNDLLSVGGEFSLD